MIADAPVDSSSADAERARAKTRLYVAGQLGGWGLLVVLQLIFTRALGRAEHNPWPLMVEYAALGILVTHFTRPLIHRWGWKELGSVALIPRVIAMAVAQSLVWSAIMFVLALSLFDLRLPDAPLWLIFLINVVNGTVMMMVWASFYFFYNSYERNHRLKIEQLQLAAHLKEAELRALKSQVNPHFIFNALNSLRALIDEDPARARQAVTQLANLLRYSLQSAQAETVPFEEELRVVSDYLALEQVRHEERLRVRLDVAPDTLTLPVPPLLLQTLVENAVKYGISTRPEGGEVTIVARRAGDQLQLSVANPGELRAPDKTRNASGSASTGLGLKNAAERLRMFFGEGASLQLRSESGPRVVAEVSIPVQPLRA